MPNLFNAAGLPSPAQVVVGTLAVALAGTSLWGVRVNQLRARHLGEANMLNIARHSDQAAWRQAQVDATARDKANADRIEGAQAQITQETENDLEDQLAAARATAERYRLQHAAAAADQGRSRDPAVSDPADATRRANEAAASALIPAADLERCAVSYVTAKGWQDWWAKVQPVMAEGATPAP